MSASILSVIAPAKVNLYLHITGRREDGYHLLDSLMVFADVADQITLHPASRFSFAIEGPYAQAFTAQDRDDTLQSKNLAVRAAYASAQFFNRKMDMRLTLTKNLPLSSGMGGGSADAAAVIWGLMRYWGMTPPPLSTLMPLMLSLGADVPVCYLCHSAQVLGIGEKLTPLDVPEMAAVLVNPRQSCATPEIFERFRAQDREFKMPVACPVFHDAFDVIEFIKHQNNDLQSAAIGKLPIIQEVITALETTHDVECVRMSGSGATVFALYPDLEAAEDAATQTMEHHPDWWVRPCTLSRVVRY